MSGRNQNNIAGYSRYWSLASEIALYINSISQPDEVIAFIVNKLAEMFQVNKVSFMLLDDAKQELFVKASRGLSVMATESRAKVGDLFGGWVVKEGKPLLVRDVEKEYPDLSRNRLTRYSTRSFVIVPLRTAEGVTGIINLTDKKDDGAFTEDDLRMLSLIGSLISLRIENIRLFDKSNSLIILDPLTNLLNHRCCHEQLLDEIYRAERYSRHLSVAVLDIDDFAYYNQNHGYAAGDCILRQMARKIKENVRQTDIISRFGPEEFMIILPETKLKDAAIVAEKIRKMISYAIFTEDESRKTHLGLAKLTVSAGVAEHKRGLRKEQLISQAAGALLEAKQKGKNQVCIYK